MVGLKHLKWLLIIDRLLPTAAFSSLFYDSRSFSLLFSLSVSLHLIGISMNGTLFFRVFLLQLVKKMEFSCLLNVPCASRHSNMSKNHPLCKSRISGRPNFLD